MRGPPVILPRTVVLDHLFVLVRPAPDGRSGEVVADEIAGALRSAGFHASPGRRHPGQGTENRPFRFAPFMLELLFVVDRDEAAHSRTAPLSLPARLAEPEASPFGFASRSVDPADTGPPWPHTLYHPDYLPPGLGIAIARDVPVNEPLWFHLPPAMLERAASSPAPSGDPGHPNGIRRLDAVELATPAPLGERSAAIAHRLAIAHDEIVRGRSAHNVSTDDGIHEGARDDGAAAGGHRLTLHFDGGVQGRRLDPHPALPVIFRC